MGEMGLADSIGKEDTHHRAPGTWTRFCDARYSCSSAAASSSHSKASLATVTSSAYRAASPRRRYSRKSSFFCARRRNHRLYLWKSPVEITTPPAASSLSRAGTLRVVMITTHMSG